MIVCVCMCVCMQVGEKEWYEVVWSERQPRQDISGRVNHLRDIYYLMAGSLSKADCSLESLLRNECWLILCNGGGKKKKKLVKNVFLKNLKYYHLRC